jgi:serine/threonine protein kinase
VTEADESVQQLQEGTACPDCQALAVAVCPHIGPAFDAVPRDTLIGSTVGHRYLVKALIGTGGHGRVYEGEHKLLRKPVAIKVLHSTRALEAEWLHRFKREAESISRLDHINICRVLDFAVGPEGQPCMIMEFLEGEALDATICGAANNCDKKLSCEQIIDIGIQSCRALGAAHSKGIIHRDIKPSNIFLLADPERPGYFHVKVLDFGLAKTLNVDDSERSLTETGKTLGTPAYMSPEQCYGKRVDGRTDIYALGCVLYEAMTGKKAFGGESMFELMAAHIHSTPVPFVQVNKDLKDYRDLEAVIFKAMEADEENRYQTCDRCLADLLKVKDGERPSVSLSNIAAKPERELRNWRRNLRWFLTVPANMSIGERALRALYVSGFYLVVAAGFIMMMGPLKIGALDISAPRDDLVLLIDAVRWKWHDAQGEKALHAARKYKKQGNHEMALKSYDDARRQLEEEMKITAADQKTEPEGFIWRSYFCQKDLAEAYRGLGMTEKAAAVEQNVKALEGELPR